MRVMIETERWRFDLNVGRNQTEDEEPDPPTVTSGDSIYPDSRDTTLGFTLPSTNWE